ncbi:RagB/SusD family nutrient uptake outer membrane protein [Pseudobacter ginsenosidimutans]|uniref:SusD-like starch-binding protein associating with outer membrane n=1 Tax=Pseudobacter ginsenosidimutans TaxID=661488 RepID=A0A4Q7N562_9BACT|nr:RagB/SusD family nutrient uptake outer membrane protein [Pseudobacter ginsenosidimutans]QEC44649.1 RagB/SusD family nutrient uptake outer membrane protein [Pseudobacter ginsenosidimutans]RZS76130.1 SusD-like starch-binding protein associating with outer membrane [Pseudobacter ginsenosidimutans]
MRSIIFSPITYISTCMVLLTGCSKLLEVEPPINTITTEELFVTNKQAEWALAGVYSKMINGGELTTTALRQIGNNYFAAGLSTILGSLSADDLFMLGSTNSVTDLFASQNKLTLSNSSKVDAIWKSAYRAIYDANAVMEGIAASTSSSLSDSVRKQLTAEALVLRAFSFFYLVNFYGDIPLTLSSEFQQTATLPRSPVAKVYDQIKSDLLKAKAVLTADFAIGNNERVRVNKWFAEALLARVYLYTGAYQSAITSASEVINHTGLFAAETDISKVFLANSKEAIFQLKPTSDEPNILNQTPESRQLYNVPPATGTYFPSYGITPELLGAFEANDKRKSLWMVPVPGGFVPAKYKNGAPAQYYTVMRMAELHLIRAEATMLLTPAAKTTAIDDLNILRRRAGVPELDDQLSAGQVIEAIAQERRTELFTEWGHRWFDLKRTGKAEEVLSAISHKQPWLGNYQLLYPIPVGEIGNNPGIIQNPEYNNR